MCKVYVPKSLKILHPNYDPILGFKLSQGDFIAYQMGNSYTKRLWVSLRYSYPDGFELHEGSSIKLGRIKLKVRKIVLNPDQDDDGALPKCFDSLGSQLNMDENLEKDAACRICFCSDVTIRNPLICPCLCSGSIKYIHVDCIKNWLKSKIETKNTNTTISYYWTDLACELCKSVIPKSIYYQDIKLDLISIEYPTRPYLLIEEFSPENLDSAAIHILSLDEGKKAVIGRAQDTDFRVSDISVSRKHSAIMFCNQKFVIFDTKSKFGTLAKMKKVIGLRVGKNISIQVGRTMFHICVKRKFNLKSFCCMTFKRVAPELSYITQEGFDHSVADHHHNNLESYSMVQRSGGVRSTFYVNN
jgi:RING-variant domain/FHA domain